jgi:two-component system, NtrC family, response regulator AtoC
MPPAADFLRRADILVVEDDALMRRRCAAFLEKLGMEVTAVGTIAEAQQALASMPFEFCLLDVNLPDGSGIDLLRQKAIPETACALVMTAEGGVEGAVAAIRLGAADYLVKPFDWDELPLRLARARQSRNASRAEQHRRAASAPSEETLFFGPSLQAARERFERILEADRRLLRQLPPVLLEGETGTGKTTFARWLHQHGPRSAGPMVEVNCAALPENLVESELFGHEKGAFTDARAARVGLMEAADGGTLFLDELTSLSLPIQAKLLTALEDRAIRRVGGNKSISIDARIIASSNTDLRELAVSGRFREDLFHRLDLFRVSLPPLRERGADLIGLAERLLDSLCRRYGLPKQPIPPAGQARLKAYAWPGNVRELAHELERALVFEAGSLLFSNLPGTAGPAASAPSALSPHFVFPEEGFSLDAVIDDLIARALRQTRGNVSAAARMLGVTRDYLRYRVKQEEPAGD